MWSKSKENASQRKYYIGKFSTCVLFFCLHNNCQTSTWEKLGEMERGFIFLWIKKKVIFLNTTQLSLKLLQMDNNVCDILGSSVQKMSHSFFCNIFLKGKLCFAKPWLLSAKFPFLSVFSMHLSSLEISLCFIHTLHFFIPFTRRNLHLH